jgi:hypothetical protein
MQISANLMVFWLGYWVVHQEDFSRTEFYEVSSILLVVNIGSACVRSFAFAHACLHAAHTLYTALGESIMQGALSFFEMVPWGQVVNRLGRDVFAIDDEVILGFCHVDA